MQNIPPFCDSTGLNVKLFNLGVTFAARFVNTSEFSMSALIPLSDLTSYNEVNRPNTLGDLCSPAAVLCRRPVNCSRRCFRAIFTGISARGNLSLHNGSLPG